MRCEGERLSRRTNWLLAANAVMLRLEQLSRALDRKYDPDQPRVPAEQPGGGQWTSGPGSSTVTDTPSGAENEVPADDLVGAILDVAQQLAAGRATLKECINLCYPILERYQPRRSDLNEFDFRKCLNACLGLR